MRFWCDEAEGHKTWKLRIPNEFSGTGLDEEYFARKEGSLDWAKGRPVVSAGYKKAKLKIRVLAGFKIQLLNGLVVREKTVLGKGIYRMFSFAAIGGNFLSGMPSETTPHAWIEDGTSGVTYTFVRARDDPRSLILWGMYKVRSCQPYETKVFRVSAGLPLGDASLMEAET
ncbi:MAG: hypothetical protein IJU95_07460 [Treponema sp.]|nr:hypothetical protein [Treponema sp.]